MKFFNRIKQSFKGFTEKVRSSSKAVTQGIKHGFEKIKGPGADRSRKSWGLTQHPIKSLLVYCRKEQQ